MTEEMTKLLAVLKKKIATEIEWGYNSTSIKLPNLKFLIESIEEMDQRLSRKPEVPPVTVPVPEPVAIPHNVPEKT